MEHTTQHRVMQAVALSSEMKREAHGCLMLTLSCGSFFYLEHARELRVVVLIDRRIGPNYNAETTVWVSFLLQTCLKIDKQPQTKTLQHPNYGSSSPNAFAPASFHKHACSLISCSTGQASRGQP